MNDFLGTAIQFSEQQLLKLEHEYDLKKQNDIDELIESGFLDSDYDGSSGEYSSSDGDQQELKDIDNKNGNDHHLQIKKAEYNYNHKPGLQQNWNEHYLLLFDDESILLFISFMCEVTKNNSEFQIVFI